jgi:hypothetical protein
MKKRGFILASAPDRGSGDVPITSFSTKMSTQLGNSKLETIGLTKTVITTFVQVTDDQMAFVPKQISFLLLELHLF